MRLGVLSDATTDALDQLNSIPIETIDQANSDVILPPPPMQPIPNYAQQYTDIIGAQDPTNTALSTLPLGTQYSNAYASALSKGMTPAQAQTYATQYTLTPGGVSLGGVSSSTWLLLAAVLGGLVLLGGRR